MNSVIKSQVSGYEPQVGATHLDSNRKIELPEKIGQNKISLERTKGRPYFSRKSALHLTRCVADGLYKSTRSAAHQEQMQCTAYALISAPGTLSSRAAIIASAAPSRESVSKRRTSSRRGAFPSFSSPSN